jgi:hypothetical protein
MLDLQGSIYTYVPGFAGRHLVGVHDSLIDVFLEVQDNRYSKMLLLIEYIAYGIRSKYSRTCAETLSKNILLRPRSEFLDPGSVMD